MRRRPQNEGAERNRVLTYALRALVVLRKGRWTMQDLADELGLPLRSAYYLRDALRDVGITVEETREGNRGFYRVPADPLRKLLRL